MRQLHLWEEMKCCVDITHKPYRNYRLSKMAKQMKGELQWQHTFNIICCSAETGQVEALCASRDPVFTSRDPVFSSHDAMYKCRRCR